MISIERDGPSATIWLDRKASANAFAVAGWRALGDGVSLLSESDARVVMLRSRVTGVFSAGADITEFDRFRTSPADRIEFRQTMRSAIDAVALLPMPTLVVIDGGCFGAAVALALACDVRIGGNAASFAVPPAKLGIAYPADDVSRLVRTVGAGQAALMLYAGGSVDADAAFRSGLLDIRVPVAEAAATVLAGQIAANAPTAVRTLKSLMRGDAHADQRFDDMFDGAELEEGLAAFRERRSPQFQ